MCSTSPIVLSLLDHRGKFRKTCAGYEMKLGVSSTLDVQRQMDRLALFGGFVSSCNPQEVHNPQTQR